MILEIIKDLPYISPSSFMQWQNCPYFTYLSKCSGQRLPPFPDSKNAALGTVVDIVLKSWVNRQHDWAFDSEQAWKNMHLLASNSAVIEDGFAIAKLLVECIKRYDLMPDVEETEDGIHGTHNGIPLFGYPDFRVVGDRPLDLKTTGYGVSYTVSPKKGYSICYNLASGLIYKDQHKNCGDPLNLIDRSWAIQLLFYNWMMGKEGLPSGKIFQVIVDRRLLAIYDAWIEEEFAEQISEQLVAMWQMYQMGENIPEPQPDEVNCKRYNQVCRASELCGFYKEWEKLK